MKLDLDEVSSGAALSRASSASLGLSFSFTGFTVPPDEIADFKPFSDDDTREYFLLLLFVQLLPVLISFCLRVLGYLPCG